MTIQRGLLRSLDWASRTIPRRWAGTPQIGGEHLDPFLHWLLLLRKARARKPLSMQTVEEARIALKEDLLPLQAEFPVRAVEDLVAPIGPDGLRCRRYVPDAENSPGGLMLYFHGGGFVVGDLDTHDDVCRLICGAGGFQVLAVDYRLAPEHPFPAAVEDAEGITRWVLANAAMFGALSSRIAVGGDSAGANLATVTALSLAAEGIRLVAQLLLYPSTDYLTVRRSRELFSDGLFLSNEDRQWFYGHYLQGADPTDVRVSPLLARSFKDVAPAVVVTAGMDVLRDEGAAYAAALAADDVLIKHLEASGLGHGFANLASVHSRSKHYVELAARHAATRLR